MGLFGKKIKNNGSKSSPRQRADARINAPELNSSDIKSILENEFDAEFYVSRYPDTQEKGLTPLEHYISFGWKEGRDPNPEFSTELYLEHNPDVRDSGIEPFYHFLKFGRKEGRSLSSQGGLASLSHDLDHVRSVLKDQFDRAFYLEQNPDVLEKGLDPLEHYVLQGWKEGRDPSPEFSSAFYLDRNLDVELTGVNPYYHYIEFGRQEGRPPKPLGDAESKPAKRQDPEIEPPSHDVSPRTAVLSMVKNEWDIIEVFAAHLLALFDVVVFVDHCSEDGTFEFLKELEAGRRDVTVYRLEEPGYLQALTMNHLVQTAKELQDVDWIFLLDADEFLPFADKAAFAAALSKHTDDSILQMHWKNLIPEDYWQHKVTWDRKCYVPAGVSRHRKVAFQPRKLGGKEFWIEQGNHSIAKWSGGPELQPSKGFDLWHLPVRSLDQLSLKLSQGVASYLQAGQSRDKVQGQHWFEILSSMKGQEITDAKLNKIVHLYGANDAEFSPLPSQDLEKLGYSKDDVVLAQVELRGSVADIENIAALIFKVNGALASKEVSEVSGRPISKLETSRDRGIRRSPDDSGYSYPALPAARETAAILDDAQQSDIAFLAEFLRPSYWAIENLTRSAWSGHIPFMYSFVSLARPSVYVELGSHWGASFFACCRALKRIGHDARCVAIDTWEGDDHAGHYDKRVFEQFCWILREYDDIARYLRMYFDEALVHFEEKSIDLLHIDGLHTYEAVRHDYESWLPKMSDQGIIFFHDINVHERDFGVWQLWGEIKKQHPTMEFRHSHGLGVAYVGTKENTKMGRLIRLMNENEEIQFLLQQHYERISEKSVEVFSSNFRLRQMEKQSGETGGLKEELSKLRQQLSALEAERDQLRALGTKKPGG